MKNEEGSLEWSLNHLMPASIQWLINCGYITRTYKGGEQIITITETGETYFNNLQQPLTKRR